MLDGIDPSQFDEFMAYREIEPDPDTRLREIVRRGFILVLGAQGREVADTLLDPWYEEPESVNDQNSVVSLVRSAYRARG